MFNVTETTPLPSTAYTAEVNALVYGQLCRKAARTLAAGHSAIADAVFAGESERISIEAIAQKENTKFYGLFLTADLATRLARLNERVNDASDADAAVARRQEKYVSKAERWISVDAASECENTLAQAMSAVRA